LRTARVVGGFSQHKTTGVITIFGGAPFLTVWWVGKIV